MADFEGRIVESEGRLCSPFFLFFIFIYYAYAALKAMKRLAIRPASEAERR